MKSFFVGLGVGVGLGMLFAPGRGEDTRRDLSERLTSIAEDAQRKAQEVARHVRGRLNDESRSDSDDSTEMPPKKDQARETAQPATSSTEGTRQGQICD
jgi:gas vesicle protein